MPVQTDKPIAPYKPKKGEAYMKAAWGEQEYGNPANRDATFGDW